MDSDVWADRAFYDDGEWVTWTEIGEHLQCQEWAEKYPNAIRSLIPYFENLMSLAECYHSETGLHLSVYGDIGELFGAITHGIKLHKNYAQGSDGRLGNDFVEIKTISPFKNKDEVLVRLDGHFSKLLVVKINEDFEISQRLVDRKDLRRQTGKPLIVKWADLPVR